MIQVGQVRRVYLGLRAIQTGCLHLTRRDRNSNGATAALGNDRVTAYQWHTRAVFSTDKALRSHRFHEQQLQHSTFPVQLSRKVARSIESMAPADSTPYIQVNDLTFAFPDGSTGLQNIKLDLPAGSRALLIGG